MMVLHQLGEVLDRATILAPDRIPGNVVTMNSPVLLRDTVNREEMGMSLVFPADAGCRAGPYPLDVPILPPIGLAPLGRRERDLLVGRIEVHRLLCQPERAGHFQL